ncbi:MAG: aspartate--tRNA(Asn) ligase, partial [Candidatus Diapherotrites archaeon]|nr:aspartate--tRNA(Asn) ligase [Candidatus Diapherotrites archaeon]
KKVTKSFDLVYKGVEIGTGAQREHRLSVLEAQCAEKGIDFSKMTFYRDIFRYGAPPHGGVGLGLDRIIQRMLNLENVREAILLPRDPERLTP